MRAIAALLTQPTIKAAATEVGVTHRTVERWLDEPTFQKEYLRQLDGLRVRLWGALVATHGEILERLFAAERSSDARIALRAIMYHLDRVLSRPLVIEQVEEDRDIGPSDLMARISALLRAAQEPEPEQGGNA